MKSSRRARRKASRRRGGRSSRAHLSSREDALEGIGGKGRDVLDRAAAAAENEVDDVEGVALGGPLLRLALVVRPARGARAGEAREVDVVVVVADDPVSQEPLSRVVVEEGFGLDVAHGRVDLRVS
jgi:hypothetical protein